MILWKEIAKVIGGLKTTLGDGRSQFSVDYKKLRELVGGRLPTDK